MLVIESGPICLYECSYKAYTQKGYSNAGMIRYISKGADYFKEFKPRPFIYYKEDSSWQDEFVDLIKDKRDVYDKYIADKKFNFKEVIRITHLYNTGELPKK